MNLVVIPFHDWKKCEQEGFRTRDAHLMQEFGKHPQVTKLLVINRPVSWAELLLLRRGRYPKHGRLISKNQGTYLSQVDDKTYTLDVVVPEFFQPLRLRRNWIPYIFAKPKLGRIVSRALQQLDMDFNYALFLSAPLFAPIVPNLSPSFLAFDAQDNLLKHALYRDTPDLKKLYNYCLEKADYISANSLETTQWFAQKRPDAEWISNGVDNEMFSPTKKYTLPPDMHNITGPIIGYAGKMQEMFDLDAIEQAIKELPEASFVFIGQKLNPEWVKSLWQYSNTYYLGDKPYHLLPQYLFAFDICIIPYNIERQHGGDPIKFYEYLAMGKPIVSTNIGGVDAFAEYPQVYIAETAAQFVSGLKQMVVHINQKKTIGIKPVPAEYLWKTKAHQIIKRISAGKSLSRA